MQNYKESSITCTKYLRARQAVFDNYLGQIPRASFIDEEVLTLPDGSTINTLVEGCTMEYRPGYTFQLVDPTTGIAIPGQSGSLDQIEVLLYSLWLQMEADKVAAKAAAAVI